MPSFPKTALCLSLMLTLSGCASSVVKKASPGSESVGDPAFHSADLLLKAERDSLFIEGDILSREGNFEKAIELFKRVVSLDSASPVPYLRLAAEYRNANKINEAIRTTEKAVAKDPKNIEAHFSLAELYTEEKSFEKAISQYYRILRLQPENSDAALYIGSLYVTTKDFKKAEQYFTSQLKNPGYGTPYLVHYYLGLMHLDQNGSQYQVAAEKAFKTSLKLNPQFEDAAISLAKLYLTQKNRSKALALCKDYEKQNHFSKKMAELKTQIYLDNEDLESAYKQLDQIGSHSTPSLDVEIKMALILIEKKLYVQAIAKLNDIITRVPNSDSARYFLAGVHEESGEVDNAINNYLLIPETSKHFSEAIVHAAYLLKGQGKINQALEVTAQGLKTKADSQVYILRATLLDAKSDLFGAVRLLEEGLAKFSLNTELLYQHAIMLDRLGKKEAMLGQMRKVLEIQPDHVPSMSYLAFSLAELNQHLSQAEELARRALQLTPQDGYVLDTLGWVLFKQKKFSEAIQVLEKAHAYQSSASVIAEHLADAYSMQSQTDKAKKMYEKAVRLSKDESQANKIRSKLKKLMS